MSDDAVQDILGNLPIDQIADQLVESPDAVEHSKGPASPVEEPAEAAAPAEEPAATTDEKKD